MFAGVRAAPESSDERDVRGIELLFPPSERGLSAQEETNLRRATSRDDDDGAPAAWSLTGTYVLLALAAAVAVAVAVLLGQGVLDENPHEKDNS